MKKDKLISYLILLGIALGLPSIVYLIQNKGNITKYAGNFSYILGNHSNNISYFGAIIFALIIILMFVVYFKLIKSSEEFKGIKEIIFIAGFVGLAFLFILPNTSRDVFFYMGNGRVIDKYGENPYKVSVRRNRK